MIAFHIFKDDSGQYRWHLKAGNGQIIADGAEGYQSKADCQHGIDLIKSGAAAAAVKDES